MPSNESKIPVGQTLVGKYRVVREIGRGGMAAVYEAEQLSLGKKVAVKVLAAELAASTIVIERFFREARAAASVKSPYIVDVYDSGRLDDGRPFIAMELLEGESLYDRMARVRIIDIETTIRTIVHTARGLMKAHGAGIVHRDLKPENIFLTKSEESEEVCKILDFGLAKFYAPMNPEEKSQKRLTREGAVFGTPAYMSPEQVKGQGTVDHRADLWALGCMAFECLIGRPVWNMDQGVAMTFASIATGPIPVPSQIRGDLPPEFDAWFKKCLERDPARRYQSARELADAFVEAWGKEGIKNSSASYPHLALTTGRHGRAVSPGLEATEAVQNPFVQAPNDSSPGSGAPTARAPMAVNGHDPSLATQRASGDVPPAGPETPRPAPKPSPLRLVLSGVFLVGSLSLAFFVWFRFASPQVFTPVVMSSATAAPSAAPSGNPLQLPTDQPKFLAIIGDGQKKLAQNDLAGAQQKFQEASNAAGNPRDAAIGRVYLEQSKFVANPKDITGGCKPVSFSRPRDKWARKAERPAVVATSKGTLVAWTEDRDVPEKDQVWSVLLDASGKPMSASRDLTPEATDAKRPQLVAHSPDRSVLVWMDQRGREAGVRARLIDADGRIDLTKGSAVLVGAGRTADFQRQSEQWPAVIGAANSFFVVWQDDRDNPGKPPEYDLFFRKLTADLDTSGPETRLTDYHSPKKSSPVGRVRYPSVAVAANTMLVAYRLDGAKDREVMRLKVNLDEAERGLPDSKDPTRQDRVLGDVTKVSDERLPGDAPSIACGKDGCFLAWHGDAPGAGVWVAGIDPNGGKVQWKKRIAEKGGHPSVAANGSQVAVAYYEANKLKMAFLSRDGVTTPSTLFRVFENSLPRPSLAAGPDGEWAIAWQDSDTSKGAPEVYAARVICR